MKNSSDTVGNQSCDLPVCSTGAQKLFDHPVESVLLTILVQVIKLRRMKGAGHIADMGERRGIYRVLVGKPEGEIPLGRPRHR
jgi:hypothetical protein